MIVVDQNLNFRNDNHSTERLKAIPPANGRYRHTAGTSEMENDAKPTRRECQEGI